MNLIIPSILDTDLYKFTMQMAVVKKYPKARVRYQFINRGKTQFPEGFAEELRKQIKMMEDLYLTKKEKDWLRNNCYFMDPTYIDFLSGYRFDSSEVGIIQKGGDLEIFIEGYWYRTILWEVPLMALISELYFKMTNQDHWQKNKRVENNAEKVTLFRMNGMHYADMGTRRRFSLEVQDEFVYQASDYIGSDKNFVGTSNVYLAMKYGIKAIGTQAHEWFMFHAAKYGFKMANHLSMENWVDVYRGDLGIALSDTLTTDVFFKSFDKKFAKLYDGVRHDSGDPLVFADKVIDHYNDLGIDPKSKAIIFSDGLNPQKAIEIKNHCRGKIKVSFGIGTNFSNDVGVKPLNMVIKMVQAKPECDEWLECIKLSDSPGKHTGDIKTIEAAKFILNLKTNE
jgi:nicotinate phosphoribosyltransferase